MCTVLQRTPEDTTSYGSDGSADVHPTWGIPKRAPIPVLPEDTLPCLNILSQTTRLDTPPLLLFGTRVN